MTTDPAYIELLYLEDAAKDYLDDHPNLTLDDAKAYVWARAGKTL